jgi:RNA polymerase sigma-70 factor (ECF subfamily)
MTNWDTIVASDGPMVWRTLWRLLANRADVEECFQETFLAALKLSHRETVECWPAVLCRLATARGMDRLRKRYRRRDQWQNDSDGTGGRRLAEEPSNDASPVEHAMVVELSERLRHALSRLSEKEAEVFYLHALCGWSHREVGQLMNMTDDAVGVTVHRSRRRLRELLGDGV